MTDPVKENIWFINGKYHRESIILQSLKLRELLEEKMKLYDDIAGHECGLDKQETNEFMVLEQLLEDSKQYD